ncbi:sensor histidine kinase YesM [Lewinella aquimaris]|uniref:Sensor histidine kinase YesM n=1 Tax=Neolewinella aquimaris TaxID=1835722 RepID=A0A840EBF4_9BACT|nr:histidine kinase [Neolewinella aquimaris]MBB4079338.1 sensor histidine kinase YesM [Neolewinella aquimaris]
MSTFLTRHKKLLLHIAFWLMYASFFYYQIAFGRKEEPEWSRVLPDFSFHILGLLTISYLNYFVFLPRLLQTQDLGRYLLRFLPVFAVLSYLFLLGKRAILLPFLGRDSWAYSTRFAVSVIITSLFIVVFVGLLRFVEHYFLLEAERKEMENRQLTSELRFLRAQVNPHFLFNTLNNVYYLAVNQSPQTADVIAKLSGMMRYMLHESNHATVPLDKEIAYMENYIDLEKMRLNDEIPIAFEVQGGRAGARIVPLILITFLENAFKHGISNSGCRSWITVSVKVEGKVLHYNVRNSRVEEHEKTVSEKSGIGLVNVRRRLKLSYPNRHQLTVTETDEEYAIHLQLLLS